MTEQAKADVDESNQSIADFTKQLAELEQSRQQVLDETTKKWADAVSEITEITVTPKKTDVYVNMFGVAWMPYYLVKSGEQVVEIPAYQ
jgi:biotin carboxyl carrier protein